MGARAKLEEKFGPTTDAGRTADDGRTERPPWFQRPEVEMVWPTTDEGRTEKTEKPLWFRRTEVGMVWPTTDAGRTESPLGSGRDEVSVGLEVGLTERVVRPSSVRSGGREVPRGGSPAGSPTMDPTWDCGLPKKPK